jgi:endonuclease YncB( thermonuclease family)
LLRPAAFAAALQLAAWTGATCTWAQQPNAPGTGKSGSAPAQPDPQPAAKIIEWVNQDFRVEKPASIYKAASDTSDALGEVLAGSDIRVIGVVVNGDWLEVLMSDETTVGYIPSEVVPAAVSPPPPPIAGHPIVRDTATLTVGDRTFLLAGIEGIPGPMAEEMQKYIAGNGDSVSCDAAGLVRYVCFLPDGTDVARVALVNGAARLGPNAPAEYAQQSDIAQQEKRGIWSQSAPQPARVIYEVNRPFNGYEAVTLATQSEAAEINFIDSEPMAMVDGEPVAVLYDDDYGWGFWDGEHRWHHAPDGWHHRLEERFPRGEGIHRHPEMFVRQQTETLRGPAGSRPGMPGSQSVGGAPRAGVPGSQFGGGEPRPGMTGAPASAPHPQAFASAAPAHPAPAFGGAPHAAPTSSASSFVQQHSASNPVQQHSASSFVQQHMSNQAIAQRGGGGFAAFGGGHPGAVGAARAAPAPVRSGGKK